MNMYNTLKGFGLPVAYCKFDEPQNLPFLIYMGAGQDVFEADNTHYSVCNKYRIEYYYKTKNEALEANFEAYLLSKGLLYSKSDDTYIESENTFVIYYEV